MMKKNFNRRFLAIAAAGMIPLCGVAMADFVVPGSAENGTIDGTAGAPNATDTDYQTYMEILASGNIGERVSFVVDLEGAENVHSVGIYGNYLYESTIQMLSDDIIVEAGDTATGPWTQIGTINVGNTRPTDPDPTIGGENPFTGGNGRIVPCDGTAASFLRISGDQAYDNHIRVFDLQVNPRLIIHRMDPVYQGVAYAPFDPGGGPSNTRAAPDLTDGLFSTRSFIGSPTTFVFDVGHATTLRNVLLHMSENDVPNLMRTGTVKTSSTDSPDNMDVTEVSFDTGGSKSVSVVELASTPNKRFFQLETGMNQNGDTPDGSTATIRLSEVDYRSVDERPVNTATVTAFAGGTEDPFTEGDVATQMFDFDYNERAAFSQTGASLELTIDLGGSTEVSSIAMYGDWSYREFISMPSGLITVEAANSDSGPWTEIGSLDVGSTRPTDPDPSIGGENPFTGGNGRRIACTPTEATHLRVTGGWDFDDPILIYEGVVNPSVVLHRVDPIDQAQSLWDVGGGPLNGRVGPEAVDGNMNTRINPKTLYTFTLDAAPEPIMMKEIRFFPMDADTFALPKTGIVRTSSTDSPTNMDTVEESFDVSITGGMVTVPLSSQPTKRYVQVEFLSAQSTTVPRIGEIEIVPVPSLVINSSVTDWSVFE